MENPPFEDVFPIQDGNFPLLCLFTGGYIFKCLIVAHVALAMQVPPSAFTRFLLTNDWLEHARTMNEMNMKSNPEKSPWDDCIFTYMNGCFLMVKYMVNVGEKIYQSHGWVMGNEMS